MTSTAAPTPEEKDETELREAEAKIKEIVSLMREGHRRDKADKTLEDARSKREEHHMDKVSAFHKHEGNHNITTTKHTKSLLELADALKIRIKLGQYALELEDSLNRAATRQVEVLERMLKRSKY